MADLVTNEGENLFLDLLTGNATIPTNLYLGLAGGTPTETSTLATITEVSGTGYARSLTTFGAASGSATGSTDETFTAGGTWTQATHVFLTDVSTGTAGDLIAVRALGTARTLASGDSLTVDLDLTAE